MSDFAQRRAQLWHAAASEELDALLISHPINVTYLTGFSGESSSLILSPRNALLVSDGRFREQIAEECPGLEAYIRNTAEPLLDATIARLQEFAPRSIGYESGHLTVADWQTLSEGVKAADWKPGRDRVETLRLVKDAGEIAQIRDAIRIAEKAFAMFRVMLRADDTEKEAVDALEGYIRRAGGTESAFPPIVAVGARAALPHAPPSQHRIGENPLLLTDWGASGPFYKSDLTRVLWTSNKVAFSADSGPSSKLQTIHGIVAEAQRRAIAAMQPGVSSKEVDTIARGYIADAGYGEFFNHGLGHGFGLQIHEGPFFRPNVEMTLQAGMVVTCEPGIYLPGWGGVRIEDDVLITPDGPEMLTHTPRELEACIVDF